MSGGTRVPLAILDGFAFALRIYGEIQCGTRRIARVVRRDGAACRSEQGTAAGAGQRRVPGRDAVTWPWPASGARARRGHLASVGARARRGHALRRTRTLPDVAHPRRDPEGTVTNHTPRSGADGSASQRRTFLESAGRPARTSVPIDARRRRFVLSSSTASTTPTTRGRHPTRCSAIWRASRALTSSRRWVSSYDCTTDFSSSRQTARAAAWTPRRSMTTRVHRNAGT